MTVELRRKLAIQASGSSVVSSIVSSWSAGHFGQLRTVDYTVDADNQHLYFSWCQPEVSDGGSLGLLGIELCWEP